MKKKNILLSLIIFCALFLTAEGAGYFIGTIRSIHGTENTHDKKNPKKSLSSLKGNNQVLRSKLAGLSPSGVYIVVDTAMNKLFLKERDKIMLEAVISSGSGNILKDPDGKRKWVFDTPRGVFSVESKYVAPVWTKPDWAFIEEGEAVPKDFKERQENGVLGDYSLGFGNGYFIHGTLYTRLLGRNVTHGCIRVGDKDLKTIYNSAGIGTKIYIY